MILLGATFLLISLQLNLNARPKIQIEQAAHKILSLLFFSVQQLAAAIIIIMNLSQDTIMIIIISVILLRYYFRSANWAAAADEGASDVWLVGCRRTATGLVACLR